MIAVIKKKRPANGRPRLLTKFYNYTENTSYWRPYSVGIQNPEFWIPPSARRQRPL